MKKLTDEELAFYRTGAVGYNVTMLLIEHIDALTAENERLREALESIHRVLGFQSGFMSAQGRKDARIIAQQALEANDD